MIVVALLALVVGATLDLDGFYCGAIVTAALMFADAVTSYLGIRSAPRKRSGWKEL